MLKFFFHRDSKFVRALEAIGALLFIPMIANRYASLIFWIYFLEYFIVRFCYNFNWYRSFKVDSRQWTVNGADEQGISLHFKKALVPASYIIFIVNLASLLGAQMALICIGIGAFAPLLYLNAILLYLHFRDKDKTPPNFFSIGKPL